jgi:hypothetical protein
VRGALVLLLLASAACGDGDAQSVQVQLIGRSSCPNVYNLSCMHSVRFQMFSDDQEFRQRCTPLAPPFETWQAFVSSRETLFVLENVRARENVRLEVRGYHNLGDENDPCENLTDDRLLLWGTSEPFDTTESSAGTINVFVDCRPRCDCNFIGNTCASDLVRGVCAPLLRRTCRNRDCTTSDDCFDSLLRCESNICEPSARGVCDVCEASTDCNSGLCVHHTYQAGEYDVDEKFCADDARCPPLDGWAHACPEGMACTRLNDGFFDLLP